MNIKEMLSGKKRQPPRGQLKPLVAKNIADELVMIEPEEYHRIEVDQAGQDATGMVTGYQRGPQWGTIYGLRTAFRAGSGIPPVHLCQRAYGPEEDREKLYIADGQQRIWAAVDLNLRIPAFIHAVKTFEEERELFLALNSTKAVHANNIVGAWTGPTAVLLRHVANGTEGNSLSGRVLFTGRGSTLVGAATLIKAASVALHCHGAVNGIMGRLSALDARYEKDKNKIKALWHLCGEVYPDGHGDAQVFWALADVFSQRKHVVPSRTVIGRIRRIKWERITAAKASDRRLLLARRIARSWPA